MFIKKSISGVMAALVGFTLQGFGLITGDKVSTYEKTTGQLFAQTDSAVWGVRICVAVIPIIAALIALILLKNFKIKNQFLLHSFCKNGNFCFKSLFFSCIIYVYFFIRRKGIKMKKNNNSSMNKNTSKTSMNMNKNNNNNSNSFNLFWR